ncbi:MAG: AraC family transcriptional regulator [Turicibacter sp.]
MTLKIENLSKCRIAYIREVGPYGPNNIHTMQKLKDWAKERNLLDETAIIFGIPQDNPETTAPQNCRYDACLVISNDFLIDDSISEGKFPGGKHAIFKIKHTAQAIQKAWSDIFPALHSEGYHIDAKPIFERYTSEMIQNHYCEICVPIK